MNSKKSRKEMAAGYKERKVLGGIYAIQNTVTGRIFVDAVTDLQGSRNRYDFSINTNMCPNPRMAQDWAEHGKDSFKYTILDSLEKSASQTMEEFKQDIAALKEIRMAQIDGTSLY